MSPERLHYVLTRQIIEIGYVRPVEVGEEDTLRRLAEMHGVILEPDSLRVWSLHPFALLPTSFWVSSGERGWWANCAWCSLGIAAAVGEDVAISTFDGGEGEPLRFEVRGGAASREDLVMHFPYPPSRWWDNPYCPCGNILFFSPADRVQGWCERHGRPLGALLDMRTAVALGRLWFGDYASPEWKRKTPAQAEAIFRELGLDREFWNLGGGFR